MNGERNMRKMGHEGEELLEKLVPLINPFVHRVAWIIFWLAIGDVLLIIWLSVNKMEMEVFDETATGWCHFGDELFENHVGSVAKGYPREERGYAPRAPVMIALTERENALSIG